MKILVPMSGSDAAFRDAGYQHCKSLIEINGKALIQHIYENLLTLRPTASDQFIFVIRKEDHAQHHLSEVLALLAPNCKVIVAEGTTAGAACTALLAVGHLSAEEELVIANADQIIRKDLVQAVGSFREQKLDGGTIVFDSIHPRWSYVRVQNGLVTEAAEKRPISRYATGGFYYFRRGADFVAAATAMIRKAAHVNGLYYVCPAFNEMILRQAKIGIHEIRPEQYYSLATPQGVQRYEELLVRLNGGAMRTARLEDMKGGWFVGAFDPTVLRTGAAEVAVKHYPAGAYEKRHLHKIATEVTVIVSGEVEMNRIRYRAGDIIMLEPGEATDFRTITAATTAVVKLPGALNDKYPCDEGGGGT